MTKYEWKDSNGTRTGEKGRWGGKGGISRLMRQNRQILD